MLTPLLLKSKYFGRLWSSQMVSQAGNRLYQIAVLWWLIHFNDVDSGMVAAAFLVAISLPAILLVKSIGSRVDSSNLRKLLLVVDGIGLGLSLVLGVLSILDILSAAIVIAVSLGLAILNAFIEPTLNKAMPRLIEKDQLDEAIAYMASTTNTANLVGAVCGAALFGWLGVTGAILINALSYAVSLYLDSTLPTEKLKPVRVVGDTAEQKSFMLRQFKGLRPILLGFTGVNFFSVPILVVLPFFVKNSLQGEATMLAAIEASIWAGIIAGPFLGRHIAKKASPLFVAGVSLGVFAMALFYAASTTRLLEIAGLFAVMGVAMGLLNARMIGYFHQTIPDDHKGRFFAYLQSLVSLAVPVGYCCFALATNVYNPNSLMYIQGCGLLAFAFLYLNLSHNRALEEKQIGI